MDGIRTQRILVVIVVKEHFLCRVHMYLQCAAQYAIGNWTLLAQYAIGKKFVVLFHLKVE